MNKKTLATIVCVLLVILVGSIFTYQELFRRQPQQSPTPSPTPATPTPSPTPATPTAPPNSLGQFGVCAQYYKEVERGAYFPDLWTLVKYVGASYVSGVVRRWAADEAAQHGIKLIMSYTTAYPDPDNPYEFASKETVKAWLNQYNIQQYRDHPGVYGHVVAHEPCMRYNFDPRYPSDELLAFIDNIRYACDYVRSLDPTHPVWVALDPAGAFSWNDANYIEKRKAWINLFIDFCDVLEYHLYLHGDAGTEYWRNPELMRSRLVTMLDQVLIPCGKGKPIIIGETGCPTGDYIDWKGEIAHFTEEQQAEYFRIYGEETQKRGILVFVFKLIDPPGETREYGLFRAENDGKINIPKVAAKLVKDYLSISPSTHVLKVNAKSISAPLKINYILKTISDWGSLEKAKYIVDMSRKLN